MANEQSGCPLRRWRPFYGAFGAIDEAIEAGGNPRAAFRDVRVRILQLLRAATDDGVAEQLCAALDDAMAEALQTLRVAHVTQSKLASTDLANAVGNLGKHHGSARIRSLASDVVRGWTTANGVAGATTVKELGKVSGDPIPCQGISTVAVAQGNVVLATAAEVHKTKLQVPPAKILVAAGAAATDVHKKKLPPPKMSTTAAIVSVRQNTSETKKPIVLEAKKPVVTQRKKLEAKKPIVAQSEKIDAEKPIMVPNEKMETKKQPAVAQSEKMETTKRKLHEGYEEAKRLKRQHLIQKISDKDASEMFEQSQRKMHRGPAARCRISSGIRRSLLPSLQLV